jgi:hypothetical protein
MSLVPRSFAAKDEIFCLFEGVLDNLGRLSQQHGLSKGTNEVVLVIEAYKTLRDRAPYPASFMLSQLAGSYAFVLFDKSTDSLLVASVCIALLLLHIRQWFVDGQLILFSNVFSALIRTPRARCRSSGGSLQMAASPSLTTLTCSKDHVASHLRLSHKVMRAHQAMSDRSCPRPLLVCWQTESLGGKCSNHC